MESIVSKTPKEVHRSFIHPELSRIHHVEMCSHACKVYHSATDLVVDESGLSHQDSYNNNYTHFV
ncbi:hypothetical protein Scep_014035 [Stephania cephalantha]|uniref:Uncharacterized protein n=1 Tax=Stephania cephalantha TaxID=152367 RepID=A0AAP0J0I8_9MAGN